MKNSPSIDPGTIRAYLLGDLCPEDMDDIEKAYFASEEALDEVAAVEQAQLDALSHRGWKPDYLTIRRRADLLPPTAVDLAAKLPLVALAAARLGATRLIDNLEIDF